MFCVHLDDYDGISLEAAEEESLRQPHYQGIIHLMREESERRMDFSMEDMRKSQI